MSDGARLGRCSDQVRRERRNADHRHSHAHLLEAFLTAAAAVMAPGSVGQTTAAVFTFG